MGIIDLIELCKTLSKSQGSYGRMLESVLELDTDKYNELDTLIKSKNFKNSLDLIMWIEG